MCFSGVLRAERAKVDRFNGFRAAVSATLDKAAMRPSQPLSQPLSQPWSNWPFFDTVGDIGGDKDSESEFFGRALIRMFYDSRQRRKLR